MEDSKKIFITFWKQFEEITRKKFWGNLHKCSEILRKIFKRVIWWNFSYILEITWRNHYYVIGNFADASTWCSYVIHEMAGQNFLSIKWRPRWNKSKKALSTFIWKNFRMWGTYQKNTEYKNIRLKMSKMTEICTKTS